MWLKYRLWFLYHIILANIVESVVKHHNQPIQPFCCNCQLLPKITILVEQQKFLEIVMRKMDGVPGERLKNVET
jgi:hypothetical protein